MWVDKGSEFCNNSFKKWLKDDDIEMYSIYNERKSVVAESVGDHIRFFKYKNIFAKGYMPNWSEEVFLVSKIKNTARWTYVINDLNGEEIIGKFYEKELQKTNQK